MPCVVPATVISSSNRQVQSLSRIKGSLSTLFSVSTHNVLRTQELVKLCEGNCILKHREHLDREHRDREHRKRERISTLLFSVRQEFRRENVLRETSGDKTGRPTPPQ